MTTLCPFNWGDGGVTFCNDGFPSRHSGARGGTRCAAFQEPDIIIEMCLSEACKPIYTLNGVDYHLKPCEVQSGCPYSGCARIRKIKAVPDEMAARAIEYHCMREKATEAKTAARC